MPDTITLSPEAASLLHRRLNREDVAVTEGNRLLYRELVDAGLMIPLSTWAGGPESRFLFTEMGWQRREEWPSATVPHP